MGYIHKLGLENFKIFSEKQDFDFAPITLLTGTNGSGKSSVSNALKIISTQFEKNILNRSGKVFDGDTILFEELIKPLKNIFNSKAEFKDLVNKNSNNEIITFFLPTFIESYNNELEIVLKYSLVDDVVSHGKLLSLTLFDKKEKIWLFEIYCVENANYFLKINYLHFFECYLEDSDNIVNFFLQSLKSHVEDSETIQINDEKTIALKILLFRNENVNIKFDGPQKIFFERLDEDELDYDSFNFLKKQINKEIRFVDDFCNKVITKYDLLFDMDKIAENEIFKCFIEKIKDEHDDKKDSNSIKSKINIEILKLLTLCELEIKSENSFPLSESVIGSFLANPTQLILKLVENSPEINEKFIINGFNAGAEKFFGLFEDILSDFGKTFFNRFIFLSIKNAIGYINESREINFLNFEIQNVKRNIFTQNNDETSKLFIDYISSFKFFDKNLIEFIKKWTLEFEIADGIHFQQMENSISLYFEKNGILYNIADESYGKSNIISIIFKIATIANATYEKGFGSFSSSVLILEEPETGLHPAFQTKLSDLFYEANEKFNIQFLIETHSEYIIRRYQVMVAEKKIDKDVLQIHYFNTPKNTPIGMQQTYPINILPDGSLTQNFGPGFFDESTNLSIALYQSLKSNLN